MVEVLSMWTIVAELLFVLLVVDVGDIRVDKEWVLLEVTLEEELLLFLEIDGF